MRGVLSRIGRWSVAGLMAATVWAGEPAGTTRFVDVNSGVDTNPGTEESPYRSISGALEALGLEGAATPWTVMIGPGTYDETVETFPITLENDGVQLIGENRETTIVDGGGAASAAGPSRSSATSRPPTRA